MPYSEVQQNTQIPTSFNTAQFIQQARQSGVSDDQTLQYLQSKGLVPASTNVQNNVEGAQLHDTGSFAGNVVNSAGNLLSGVGQAIVHPIDTVTNIGKGIIGTGEYLGAAVTGGPKPTGEAADVAANIGNFIKQRYGSLEAAKTTAYQDPIGFLADASLVLGGAGGAIGRAGEVSKVGEIAKAGEMIGRAGDVANPFTIAGKVSTPILRPVGEFLGNQVANMLGTTTGVGGSSIRGVFNAAKEGNPEAMQAVRGSVGADQIIEDAQNAFNKLKQNKNITYQQQLQKVKSVAGEVDYQPAVEEFRKQLTNNGITVKSGELQFENARGFQSSGEQAILQNVYDKMERWGDMPSNTTLYGLDTLKQQLGEFVEMSNGKSKALIASTKTALSDILKQSDEYKNLVEPYESTSRLIDEIRTDLMSKNPETALKKLTQAVKQDNEYRQSLIEELNKVSQQDIMAELSGLNMSKLVNTGKLSTFLEMGTAFLHPHLWPILLASSPRIVAEFMNTLGYSAKQIDAGLSVIKTMKLAQVATGASRITSSQQNTAKKKQGSSSEPGILNNRVQPQKQ